MDKPSQLPAELLVPLKQPKRSALPSDVQRSLLALLNGLQPAVDRTEAAFRGSSIDEARDAFTMVPVYAEVIAASVRADFGAAEQILAAARKRLTGP